MSLWHEAQATGVGTMGMPQSEASPQQAVETFTADQDAESGQVEVAVGDQGAPLEPDNALVVDDDDAPAG